MALSIIVSSFLWLFVLRLAVIWGANYFLTGMYFDRLSSALGLVGAVAVFEIVYWIVAFQITATMSADSYEDHGHMLAVMLSSSAAHWLLFVLRPLALWVFTTVIPGYRLTRANPAVAVTLAVYVLEYFVGQVAARPALLFYLTT